MLGPTGVGKTYLVRTIADLIGVPFVKADATKFSETGYVGGDVEDLVRELVHKADGNVRLAEYGIIYLDEIDKIATPMNVLGRDVSGGGVQRGLLKLMEETEVSLRTPFDLTSQLQAAMEFQSKGKVSHSVVNTRHILFIVSGAFTGLADIIRRRMGAKAIGFHATGRPVPRDEDYFQYAKSNDFIEYGFESEFVGRLPVVVSCQELSVDDLFQILKNSEGSIMRQYVNAFDAYGIDLVPSDSGLYRIAQKAYEEHTGARSLVGVCERTFREYKYNLPHSAVKRLELDAELVNSPDAVLERILESAKTDQLGQMDLAFNSIAEEWSKRNGIQIHLHPEAARLLSQKALDSGDKLEDVFSNTFKDYEHGLNLIRRTQGVQQFEITEDVVRDPRATLDQWIRAYYISR
jgi:endopeptidase Clp ATP-binding regulatory subunit ClpX